MFGFNEPKATEYVAVASSATQSDAPFRLEFAPGMMVVNAEISDRQSLNVFVAALQAMGALLPDSKAPPAIPSPPPVKPELPTQTIDLTPTAVVAPPAPPIAIVNPPVG